MDKGRKSRRNGERVGTAKSQRERLINSALQFSTIQSPNVQVELVDFPF